MSNALAIATVTATLRQLLQTGVSADVPGVTVKTIRPTPTDNAQTLPEVNIFLYQVLPNLGYRNCDLPTRDASGNLLSRPFIGLDLYYLISCVGDEAQIIPQRLLGSIVRTMITTPILSRQMIIDTINNPAFSYLELSDLAEQIESIKFVPLSYSLDELSKAWSIFYQIPYVLSVGYLATVVLIDADQTPAPKPMVQQRKLYTEASVDRLLKPATAVTIVNEKTTKTIDGQGQISGEVFITKAEDETYIDYYALYWGANAFDKSHIITTLMKTGSDLTYPLPLNTIIPLGANYLVVFTGNVRDVMTYGITTPINYQSPPNFPANGIDFTDTDFNKGLISGPVTILKAVDERIITQYNLYWGADSNNKLKRQPVITTLPKTGLNLVYYFPADTPVPLGANYLLVYTQNTYGEMASGIGAPINDKFIPMNPPKGIQFINMSSQKGEIAGPVTIFKAADESDINDYSLYWGQSATQKLSGDPVAILAATGFNVIYTFPPSTSIPDGVAYLLAFSRNQYGEMLVGVSVPISP